jgi:Ca-activated chloride channel family protein
VQALNRIRAEYGTAIGDAISRSLDLGIATLDKNNVKDGKVIGDADGQSPLVILLLSDGASTTGDYTPLEAAQLAKDANVPVFTVAFGTDSGTVEGPDGYGGIRTIRVPPDPETLRQIAETTGGKFFAAADAGSLTSVYDQIGSQVGVEHKTRELTVVFTGAGALLLLAGAALSMLWFARLP